MYEIRFKISQLRDMQIKTSTTFLLTQIRLAVIKKANITSAGKEVGKKKPVFHAGVTVKWSSQYANQYGERVFRNEKQLSHMTLCLGLT